MDYYHHVHPLKWKAGAQKLRVWRRWVSFSNRWFSGSMFARNQTLTSYRWCVQIIRNGTGLGLKHLPKNHCTWKMLIPRGTVRNFAHPNFLAAASKGKFRTIQGAYDHRMPVSLLFQVSIVAIWKDRIKHHSWTIPSPSLNQHNTGKSTPFVWILPTENLEVSTRTMNLKNPNLPQ